MTRCIRPKAHRPATILLAVMAASAAQAEPVHSLGKLEPFWRHSATLGPHLETGYSMIEIPSYLAEGDFPYRKRPSRREAPFADHLSVVRLLGGYAGDGVPQPDRDLAYRAADGRIEYRWELLEPRLRPAIDQGYELTLVLDNVPWCFPDVPRLGGFGQCVPPGDPEEWTDFISELCRRLATLLGPDRAGRLRFRLGTENNGRERFDGSEDRYLQHYDTTARAIRDVLSTAEVGPFNISGASIRGMDRLQNVNAFTLAEHCRDERSGSGARLDWIAFSRYYAPGTLPAASADECRLIWEEFERRVPGLVGVSREVHEFGIAPFGEASRGGFVSAEPGALGAALTCQMMLWLREARVDRLWHWNVYETVRDHEHRPLHLFDGDAWVLSVLEHQVGSEATLVPLAPSTIGTSLLAAVFTTPRRAVLLTAAYHPDPAKHTPESLVVSVPKDLWPHAVSRARRVRLNRRTSVWDRIRRDLEMAGLLTDDYVARPDRLGSIRQMGNDRAGERFVAARYDDYARAWVESLTLTPLDDGVALRKDEDGMKVSLSLTAPEIAVVVLDAEDARDGDSRHGDAATAASASVRWREDGDRAPSTPRPVSSPMNRSGADSFEGDMP
ncbi:MAG: GH39 family glycosyl hydrolase [Pirellulales bacterium]